MTVGRIVETEAYLGREDPASHAYRGRLHPGNRSLYLRAGTWYVYRSYGIHWCANVVCRPEGVGGAVLLRGIVPMTGVAAMRRRRRGVPDRRIGDGPGKLCQALGITRSLDGQLVASSPVRIHEGVPVDDIAVSVTPRIGITRAADWPLRFVVDPFG